MRKCLLTADSKWKWPEIPGLHDFQGKLLHSASWDDSYNFNDKNVIVIGSGSSAIQIVPQLQPGKPARARIFLNLTEPQQLSSI